MATFDELFSFNKENEADFVDAPPPEVQTLVEETVIEETLIEDAPVEQQIVEPTLESMLSVDPECLPAPDVDAPTLESKLEALVGQMIPDEQAAVKKNNVTVEDEPPLKPSDFAPAAQDVVISQEVVLGSEEVIVGSQELNPDNYEILDGPIETMVNHNGQDEEMTLNLVPVEEGIVEQHPYGSGHDQFGEASYPESTAEGEHILYDASQNDNSIFDEKPKPMILQNSSNFENIEER